jgi:hypothetical protein
VKLTGILLTAIWPESAAAAAAAAAAAGSIGSCLGKEKKMHLENLITGC